MQTWRQHDPHSKQAARGPRPEHTPTLSPPAPSQVSPMTGADAEAAAAAPDPSQWPSRIVDSCEVHPCPRPTPRAFKLQPSGCLFRSWVLPMDRPGWRPFLPDTPSLPAHCCQLQYDIYLLLAPPWLPIDPPLPARSTSIARSEDLCRSMYFATSHIVTCMYVLLTVQPSLSAVRTSTGAGGRRVRLLDSQFSQFSQFALRGSHAGSRQSVSALGIWDGRTASRFANAPCRGPLPSLSASGFPSPHLGSCWHGRIVPVPFAHRCITASLHAHA
ncbi:hypothetical protein C8Q74DRAFT_697873 [Fomes fomentarius]|nr:hypothetical protein C8Q74DRAFT_697873 [Fomes fomentarius]